MNRVWRIGAVLSVVFALSAPAGAQDALATRVSLDLKAMSPGEAFGVIGKAIGYTVDVAPDVAAPVDVLIPNVTAKTALTAICESIGCTWQANGTVIVVRKRPTDSAQGRLAGVYAKVPRSDGASLKNELTQRMNTVLPAGMKFENAPTSVVAERLSQAVGLEVRFVSERPGQTLSVDLSRRTFREALKILGEHHQGAILLRGTHGNRSFSMQVGKAKRPK